MKLSSSVKAALALAVIVTLYFGLSTLFRSKPSAAEAETGDTLFAVVTKTISPTAWRDEVVVRGRTEALRSATLRAETPGSVEATPATLGASVKKGDVLCKLRIDARRAALKEARASLAKAKLDYDASRKLAEEGFRAETSVASLRAAYDLARANVEQATLNLQKTEITAPFDGIFDQRAVEVGDFLGVGDPCGVVIQLSPFLVTGAVSEQDVNKISVGDKGVARLATGETVEGKVRFIATAADAATRTFKVELEIPNEDGRLKDGVTADFTVFAARRDAHLAPHSSLTLDDLGRISVRLVEDGDTVTTKQITLLGESEAGVWIAGLNGPAELIVRGQEYVAAGQKVEIADLTAGEQPAETEQ